MSRWPTGTAGWPRGPDVPPRSWPRPTASRSPRHIDGSRRLAGAGFTPPGARAAQVEHARLCTLRPLLLNDRAVDHARLCDGPIHGPVVPAIDLEVAVVVP